MSINFDTEGTVMLLFIFLAIMTTLAISQGLLLLFLIRSRVHMLHLAQEIINLHTHTRQIHELKSSLTEFEIALKNHLQERTETIEDDDPRIRPLAAVGS